ncbi:MAG TPA: Ig-like domain repeat protein [Candidatus Dormibacteraeota bacterium]|nr:Ig-like domain repeat protein [Candidatus Dormibacteraeota bacterium]
MQKTQSLFRIALSVLSVAFTPQFARAQSAAPSAIPAVNSQQRVTLSGNVHPLAQARFDHGAVADSTPAPRLLLLLRRSPQQESALQEFLLQVHRPGTPTFHAWLKPEQFAAKFGPSDADVTTVTNWLKSQGFANLHLSKAKNFLEFSGTAGQLRNAFQTEIHSYIINGEEHHANNSDPQIPSDLAPIVAGLVTLNDFPAKSHATILGTAKMDSATHKIIADWTFRQGLYPLAPADFAVQYNLNSLYSASTNGSGVSIGIISASNVDPSVVATYRTFFSLPANPVNVVLDGADPGLNSAAGEAYLDVELAGAVAPNAKIVLYTSLGNTVQNGLYLAALRAVDDDEATVLSTSYGLCEQDLGSSGNLFWSTVWQQAAAQGQTSFVSAGDGGSAGCDNFNIPQPASRGLAVSGFASTPWNIAVGGTDFAYQSYAGTEAQQNAELATFWKNPVTPPLPSESLLKRIPEQPWNRAFGLNLSNANPPDLASIVGGSGGASSCATGTDASDGTFSSCTSGHPKPSWQSGTGVPTDGVRDLPDISLFAASGENDTFYPICVVSTQCVVTSDGFSFSGAGGTSASSPAMAGIMALINQKFGRQGQANYILYALAAQHPSVFHDITIGSNNVPCQSGSPNCTASTRNDNTNGLLTLGNYYSTAGYDQASGLGTVDAAALIANWNSIHFTATNTSLSVNPTTFTHGTVATVTANVTGTGGAPSGDVALVTTATPASNTGLAPLTLSNGSASGTLNNLPGGQYTLTAHYPGDNRFASSDSQPVTVNISPEDSTTSLSGRYFYFGQTAYTTFTNGGTYQYGLVPGIDAQPLGVHAPVGSNDGLATGTVIFTDSASTGSLSSPSISINLNGLAEWRPDSPLVGSHSISASYSGDASFHPSTSTTPLTFTITKTTPSAELFINQSTSQSASPVVMGLNDTIPAVAHIGITTKGLFPTGPVKFFADNISLGTAQLAQWPFNKTVSEATLDLSGLSLGSHSITATYDGDANYNGVTLSPVSVLVKQPATVGISAPNIANLVQNFNVTANVTGVNGQPAPTGSVVFTAVGGFDTSVFGGDLINGATSSSVDPGFFGLATVAFTAQYLGDSVYAPHTVNFSVAIVLPFSVSGTPVTISAPGITTGNTSTLTMTPAAGFTGPVNLTCAPKTPSTAATAPTCSIPASVAITGANPVAATMTINTTAPHTSIALIPPIFPYNFPWQPLLAASLFLLLLAIYPRTRRRLVFAALILSFSAGLFAGCGGGASSTPPPPVQIPGTAPGTYIFTVTASTPGPNAGLAVVSTQTTVTVTVQ